ncbi:MAG: hypothetical protein ABEJ48_06805 [Halobacteriales archaeon]
MRGPGLIGLLQLAGTLVLAIPAGLFGLERLVAGELFVGGAFLGLTALFVLAGRYLTNPLDPGDVAEAAVERAADYTNDEE